MFSKLSNWMDVFSLHKHNMDQLISQMKKKMILKKGHQESWEEIWTFSITCFAINLTLFHPFKNISSFLTQCSQIIRKDVIIKTARRIFLMIQSSGENMKYMLGVDTPLEPWETATVFFVDLLQWKFYQISNIK